MFIDSLHREWFSNPNITCLMPSLLISFIDHVNIIIFNNWFSIQFLIFVLYAVASYFNGDKFSFYSTWKDCNTLCTKTPSPFPMTKSKNHRKGLISAFIWSWTTPLLTLAVFKCRKRRSHVRLSTLKLKNEYCIMQLCFVVLNLI